MSRFAALPLWVYSRIGSRAPESSVSQFSVLASLYWPWMAGLIAITLSIPAWSSGFQLDDFYH